MHPQRRTYLPLMLLTLLLTCLAGCGEDAPDSGSGDSSGSGDTGSGDTGTVDLHGTYVADSIDSSSHTLVKGSMIRLTFQEDRVSVQAGCNTMMGGVAQQDGTLVVDTLGGTQMACDEALMKQDDWLSSFLTSTPAISADGDAFTLSTDDATIRFAPEMAPPDASLANTTWHLETILSGSGADGAASSVPADARHPMLKFTNGVAGWDVSFSTGCNQGRGPVEIKAKTMDFGALMTTKMACPDAVGQLEQTFLGVLGKDTSYVIKGDQLTLTAADGKSGLVFRAG